MSLEEQLETLAVTSSTYSIGQKSTIQYLHSTLNYFKAPSGCSHAVFLQSAKCILCSLVS